MIAKAMPIPKAQPIWKRPPNAAAPMGFVALSVKVVMAAIPGKLPDHQCVAVMQSWSS